MDTGTLLPTCYRHPDRETRLACSNCGRPICVDCVRTGDTGQRCLECAAPAPGAEALDMEDQRRRQPKPAVVTFTILAVSVAVFLVERLVPGMGDRVGRSFAQYNVLVEAGEWWRLITAAFLHSGEAHIAFNMFALYLFGPQLEREVGAVPFAGLYLASAIAGGAGWFVFGHPTIGAVGASGAIFGLFGAWLAASYRGRHTATGRASLRQLLVLLGINLALGFVPGANIAWQALVGGLLAGLLVAGVWMLPGMRRQAVLRALVAAVVAVGALLPAL